VFFPHEYLQDLCQHTYIHMYIHRYEKMKKKTLNERMTFLPKRTQSMPRTINIPKTKFSMIDTHKCIFSIAVFRTCLFVSRFLTKISMFSLFRKFAAKVCFAGSNKSFFLKTLEFENKLLCMKCVNCDSTSP
jgi:hypothetical protein